jgi:tetratricopeptide (TPR) repeat protein
VTDARKLKRQERRDRIRESWEERYDELVSGDVTLAEILGYDDARLMKLAAKGNRLFKVGKWAAAAKVFRGLVVLDPMVPYFHYLHGSAQEKLANLDRAKKEYRCTLDLTDGVEPPPDIVAFARLGLGRVLARLGALEEAKACLRPVASGAILGSDPAIPAAAQLILQHLETEILRSP